MSWGRVEQFFVSRRGLNSSWVHPPSETQPCLLMFTTPTKIPTSTAFNPTHPREGLISDVLITLIFSALWSTIYGDSLHQVYCTIFLAENSKKISPPSSVMTTTTVSGPPPSGLNTLRDTRYWV